MSAQQNKKPLPFPVIIAIVVAYGAGLGTLLGLSADWTPAWARAGLLSMTGVLAGILVVRRQRRMRDRST